MTYIAFTEPGLKSINLVRVGITTPGVTASTSAVIVSEHLNDEPEDPANPFIGLIHPCGV